MRDHELSPATAGARTRLREAELTGSCPGSLPSLFRGLIPDVLVSPSIGQADVTLSQDWPHSGLLYLVIRMPCRL